MPACVKIGKKVVVSGGYNGGTLRSTEVLDLETRKIEYAGDLATPRRGFHIHKIVTEGLERYLAMGGNSGHSSKTDSVEEFDVETMTWKSAPEKLSEEIGFFGAVALQRSLVC